jgi:hypothetical protein
MPNSYDSRIDGLRGVIVGTAPGQGSQRTQFRQPAFKLAAAPQPAVKLRPRARYPDEHLPMDCRLVAGAGRRLSNRLALLHHRRSGTQPQGLAWQEAAIGKLASAWSSSDLASVIDLPAGDRVPNMAKGRRTEIEFMNGFIAEKGLEAGVPAPVHAMLTVVVKRVERGEITADPANVWMNR